MGIQEALPLLTALITLWGAVLGLQAVKLQVYLTSLQLQQKSKRRRRP